jgi:hypothetical protein
MDNYNALDESLEVEDSVDHKPLLSSWRLAAISFFWCTYQITVTALYMILFPLQTELLTSPDGKGLALGFLLLVGAIGSFSSPIWGVIFFFAMTNIHRYSAIDALRGLAKDVLLS